MAPTFGLIGTSLVVIAAGSLVGGAGEGVADAVTGGHRPAGLVRRWYLALAILCNRSAYCTLIRGVAENKQYITTPPHI